MSLVKRTTTFLAATSLLGSLLGPIGPAFAASANLLANPSVETTTSGSQPANWTADTWGTNTASLSYANTGNTGNHSLLTTMSARSDGDAKWIPDAVNVNASQSYTYSEYYKSSIATELDAQYTDASGAISYVYLTTVPASTSWAPISYNFTTPANVSTISVMNILATVGSLQTDDFSLSTMTVTPPTPQPVSGNLIANSSFETANGSTPANWQTGGWGTNTSQYTYGTTGHSGSRSATVAMTAYTSGDAKWYANPATVTPGASYTYSDYYQATTTTSVIAMLTSSNGTVSYVSLPDATASTAWTQYSTTLTIPAGGTSVTVFHLLAAVGRLTIDDVNLNTYTAPVTTNMITNPSMETASSVTAPQAWTASTWGTNNTTFSYLSTGAHSGSRAVSTTINSYTDGDSKWVFNNVNVAQDTQYTYSDYYKATVNTELDAAFTMSDGSILYQIIGLPDATTNWTQFTTTFAVPLGAKSVSVYHLIHSIGTLSLDDANMQVYKPTGFKRGLVSLTFDDSLASQYTQGLPLLQKNNFLATFYVISGLVNTSGYMTTAQVQALSKANDEIGAHTVTHTNMLTESAATADSEFSKSKSQLQTWTGKTITNFAYPNGLFDKALNTDAAKYYSTTRGVEEGFNSKDNLNFYDIKVQNISNTTTTAQVADWVKQAQATNTWLVLVYHSIEASATSSSEYNTTPTNLNSQLGAIKTSGITVETLAQAVTEVKAQ